MHNHKWHTHTDISGGELIKCNPLYSLSRVLRRFPHVVFCMGASAGANNTTTLDDFDYTFYTKINWLIKPKRVCHVTANHQFTLAKDKIPIVWQRARSPTHSHTQRNQFSNQIQVRMFFWLCSSVRQRNGKHNYWCVLKSGFVVIEWLWMFHIHWSFIVSCVRVFFLCCSHSVIFLFDARRTRCWTISMWVFLSSLHCFVLQDIQMAHLDGWVVNLGS